MGITFTILSAFGNFPIVKDVLMILHRGKMIKSGISASNFIGMLEGPVALLFSDLMISRTSSVEFYSLKKFLEKFYQEVCLEYLFRY